MKFHWKFNFTLFIIVAIIVSFLEILIFFIATHSLSIPLGQRMNFDSPRIYSTLVGIFILSLALIYWVEWHIRGKNNNLFLALWIGPAVSLLFILLTWMLSDINLGFGGAQDHYLLIPTAGISLFLSAILTIICQQSQRVESGIFKSSTIILTLFTLGVFYFLNKGLIYSYFNHVNVNGRAASGQIMIQSKFREHVKDVDFSKPALFYFDTSELSGDGPFYTEGLLSPLPFFMHFKGEGLVDGCVEVFYDSKKNLVKLIEEHDGEKGFSYRSLCLMDGKGGYRQIFHKRENFYAFKLKNKDFIDIKEEVLKEIGF